MGRKSRRAVGREVTRDAWDAEWRACFGRLRAKGTELLEAQRLARDITSARYGPQPSGHSLWMRLGLKVVGKKMAGLGPVEVSPMLQRVIVAVVYGIGAAGPVLAAAFEDAVVSGGEWSGIATAFFIAFWGTYKSNKTIVAANRTAWTEQQRAEADVIAVEKAAGRP